jgi:hypothetical protein
MLQIGFVEEVKKQLEEAKIIFIDVNEQKQITEIDEVLSCISKMQ